MAEQKAPLHMATIQTDKPKDVVVGQWEVANPDCTVKHSQINGRLVTISYTKRAEEAAALLAHVEESKCVGTIDAQGNYAGERYW